MSSSAPITLYIAPPCWGLPSVSVACIQAEAYLRFAGATVHVDSSSKSPTGMLPAMECGSEVSSVEADDAAAARSVFVFARKHSRDLDAGLTAAQRAELLAFSTLMQKLATATAVASWCEAKGFSEYKKAAYQTALPFPLSYIIPWSQRREMLKKYGHLVPEQVFEEAVTVIGAVSDRLRASGGRYFFGPNPSSIDALIYGHMAYFRASAAVPPTLKDKVTGLAILSDYLDHIRYSLFAEPATQSSSSSSRSSTRANGQSHGAAAEEGAGQSSSSSSWGRNRALPSNPPTANEIEFKRNSWFWMAASSAAIASYVLLSGRYVTIAQLTDMLRSVEEEDDEEGEE
ncbi:MAG: hypothetical protein WDW36_006154 [Sanguina aurantia]